MATSVGSKRTTRDESTTVVMTREEIVEILERDAMARRGITANEMLTSYEAGRLADPAELIDLLILSDLLEDTDPIFSRR